MTEWQLWSLTMLALALAVWLLMRSARRQTEQAVGGEAPKRRRRTLTPRETLVEWLYDYLVSAGLSITPRAVAIGGGVLVMLVMLALVLAGSRFGPLLVAGGLLLANALLRLRAARLRETSRSQLAPFMESVMRELGSGKNLEVAFRQAARRVPAPLGDALQRILIRRDLGLELHDGLVREARLLKLFELQLLATTVQISQVHGGSLRDMLASFVAMLHLQERGRRELSAMTGETRVTAVVLGAMPILMAAYMFFFNYEFMRPMLESSGGQVALAVAAAMQVAGAVALWRMLKSV
ncbi:type II secretion system F family protein [Halomonas mongoliensis]|uniref:type II secretion system F family protein n=1 Tax=Halomonas mongoliensis TaxID=321265 RepID=UPI00403B300C